MLMSIFSSFDAFNAESLGQKVTFSWPAGLKKEAKLQGSSPRVSDQKTGASDGSNRGKEGLSSLPNKKLGDNQQQQKRRPRFAVELDGVHCFETIIPY